MYCFGCSTGLYYSENIGINTMNIELILNLIILLVCMGGHGLTEICNVYYIFFFLFFTS